MKNLNLSLFLILCVTIFCSANIQAQENCNNSSFEQLYNELPTPNSYRTASGAPGSHYWQQEANYKISVELNDEKQQLRGSEQITYFNNSPDNLSYLWLQLDQNIREHASFSDEIKPAYSLKEFEVWNLSDYHSDFQGGFNIEKVCLTNGNLLQYTINKTMMRIDLPTSLLSGDSITFQINWWYNINDRKLYGGNRSGCEFFERDGNYIYTLGQFYPRMAVYNDHEGWQNKQFIGTGEFALTFGNFVVEITAPSDHIVAATGELQNQKQVLTKSQIDSLEKAKTASKPIIIHSGKEALLAENSKSTTTKTWIFAAENVRDFAFASSRKFIWDAKGVPLKNKTIMAMSFYPNEANPLWEKYATEVVAHTIAFYSDFLFEYPYPVAQAVHTEDIGMEYPMISFDGGRPYNDGSYSEFTKNSMISIIVHETGHNFSPMIINSDERQWTWMDEGLNTFIQYLAEQSWEPGFPSWTGTPESIINYMSGNKKYMRPIMINSESIIHLTENAYYKPAVALNILRETIMGHELFDFAIKEYANRWKFKNPTPADFFRTMEDASATDLDWFWRSWFFTTNHVDIAIEDVQIFHITGDETKLHNTITNATSQPYTPKYFSKTSFDKHFASALEHIDSLNIEDYYYLKVFFKNIGKIPMPIILKIVYSDDTEEIKRTAAEIWLKNEELCAKLFLCKKPIKEIILDPYKETADTDAKNNCWPNKNP